MTSLEFNEIVRGDTFARSSYEDMAFCIDAGRIAKIVADTGNCVVNGVATEPQAAAITKDIAVIATGYGLTAESVDVSQGVTDEAAVDHVDTFLAGITSRESGLLIVGGLNKLMGAPGKADGARGAFLQRIVKLVRDPSGPVVCAINMGDTDHSVSPRGFWANFKHSYDFRGFIQPPDAVNILNEYYPLGDAREIAHQLHINGNLTYAQVDELTRHQNVLADQA